MPRLPSLDQPPGALPTRGTPLVLAVLGDVHGHHAEAIEALARACEAAGSPARGTPPDRILQVGDFEPIRDAEDLASVAGPAKYRLPGDFARVLAGEIGYPAPVDFIGGNHEPYALLEDLSEGGPVAEEIRYLGRAGEAEIDGIRLAYLSGIHSPRVFDDPDARRRLDWHRARAKEKKIPTYFTREEIERLDGLERADLLLLHDWPTQMIRAADLGDPPDPRFRETARRFAAAGDRHVRALMERLRPAYALCGHMHAALFGTVPRGEGGVTRILGLDQVTGEGACVAILRLEPDGSAGAAAYDRFGALAAGA